MTQSDLRIESICAEFDARLEQVGVVMARLELAKALAENEETVAELSAELLEMRVGAEVWGITIDEARAVIEKCALTDALNGIQPPPYVTAWLDKYEGGSK